eukprot:5902935-Amphidinium_carterae.1
MIEGASPPAFNQPSQMQQIISTASLKELQRSSTFTTSPKWTDGYIWASIHDAGQWVLGNIRPTRSITGNRYNPDGSKITTASCLWHVHRDPVFALSSAFYHLSMIPGYGDHQPPAEPASPTAADATAGQPAPAATTADQQAAGQQPTATGEAASEAARPFVKWCLINVLINEDVVNSMADPATAEKHLKEKAFIPSRYNRRFVDYSIELVYDGTQDISTINISEVFHIKSVWGSTLSSPFIPTPSLWLASHLLDYSLVSSNIWVYINSVLELSAHPTIKGKLAYFCHNIFSSNISNLLINPTTGDWIEYRGINVNLQHN